MIPTVLIAGLLIGRWWFVPLAAVGWCVLLFLDGDVEGVSGYLGGAALGAVNAVVAVGIRQLISRWVPNQIPGP